MSDISAPSPTPRAANEVAAGSSSPGARKRHPAFWVTNHVVNPIVKALLRSGIGHRWGRKLVLVTYQGRRTTARRELVAMYAREGDVVWIVPGQPEKKLWWRNFRTPGNVELLLAGECIRGTAVAIEGRVDPDTLAAGLEAYGRTFPGDQSNMKRMGPNSRAASRPTVIVRVQLVDEPDV